MTKKGDGLRDPTGAARIAIAGLWLWFAIVAAEGLGRIGEIDVVGGFGGPIADHAGLVRSDQATDLLAALSAIGLGVAALPLLRWIYVTNRNAHALNPQLEWEPHSTPLWAVAWFFVPMAALLRPFTVFAKTWRVSTAPNAHETVRIPALLHWWWGLWLLEMATRKVAAILHNNAKGPADLIGADYVLLANVLLDLPLTVVLTIIILRLSKRQRAAIRGDVAAD